MYLVDFNYKAKRNYKNGDYTKCEYKIINSTPEQLFVVGYSEELDAVGIASEEAFEIELHFEEYFAERGETVRRIEKIRPRAGADKEKAIKFINSEYEEVKEIIIN